MLLCCFLVHFAFNSDFVLLQLGGKYYSFVFFTLAITLLLYPVIGLLADIYCNRYNCIKVSIILLSVSSLTGLGIAVAALVITEMQPSLLIHTTISSLGVVLVTAVIIVVLFSLGMFEAVGIQFGMDQMVEASSDQISAFTHWYYWSMNIGIGIQATTALCGFYVFSQCTLPVQTVQSSGSWNGHDFAATAEFTIIFVIQTVSVLASLLSLYKFSKHLTIEPAGHNHFTTVYKVLKYAWQHKCPERRSAFTYWEEDIPPRIDLGKSKYGGPFTTEEVEDVKTFITLLLVLSSLFGFHLADNGYSVIRQLNFKFCPSQILQAGVTVSPNILQTVTVMVSIPILHFLLLPRLHRYIPNMLHRLGIGSVLMLLQELAGIVIVLSSLEEYGTCSVVNAGTPFANVYPIGGCISSHMYYRLNNSCTNMVRYKYCGHGDHLFLYAFIPIIIRTIAYHLVFMTALEFISAQAPLKMKGSLITLWYALSALRFFIQTVNVFYIYEDRTWLIFNGVKASLMLLSILLYCCVAKRYRYRLRDEVVNERYLVEEVYDRELRLAEQYEREKNEEMRALYGVRGPKYGAVDS